MRRLHYKNGTFKDVDDSQSWEYENDPDWERTEDISILNGFRMTKWCFKTLEQFVENNYWENPEDAIGDIRKFITINKEKDKNVPLEPLQSIFDILHSPYLGQEEKVQQAISKTSEISTQIKENLGRFLRKAHINCSHDMETAKGFVTLLKIFNMYGESFEKEKKDGCKRD